MYEASGLIGRQNVSQFQLFLLNSVAIIVKGYRLYNNVGHYIIEHKCTATDLIAYICMDAFNMQQNQYSSVLQIIFNSNKEIFVGGPACIHQALYLLYVCVFDVYTKCYRSIF